MKIQNSKLIKKNFLHFFLLFYCLIFVFWLNPIPVRAQEIPIPAQVANLDIFVQVTKSGQLKVSQVFTLSDSISTDFSWTINSRQISNLTVYQGDQIIPRQGYQIKKNQDQIVISGLSAVTSGQVWKINFQQKGDFTPKKSVDEFRYQPISNSGANIGNLDVLITFPEKLDPAFTSQSLYAIHGVDQSQYSYSNNTLNYSAENLSPYSSFTAVAMIKKGLIKIPLSTKILAALNLVGFDYWLAIAVALPLITFVGLLIMVFLKRKRENIRVPENLIETPPSQMSPMLVGALFRQKIGPREIAAEILNLAIFGYLMIVEKYSGYSIGERKPLADLKSYEKSLSDELLKGHLKESLASLKEAPQKELFSEAVNNIYNQTYNEIARRGFFVVNPRTVFLRYKIFGMAFFFLSVLMFFIAPVFVDPPYIVLAFFSASLVSLMIIALAGSMPTRTRASQVELEKWLAFRKFLIEYRHLAGFAEIYQDQFIKYLPYAVVLDCERQWANHFAQAPFRVPDWYQPYYEIGSLPEFTKHSYPLIDTIAKTMLSLKEPIY